MLGVRSRTQERMATTEQGALGRALGALARGVRKVPWIVWALIAPAVILGTCKLWSGPGRPVHVVGAGPIHHVRAQDAPKGARYELAHRTRESLQSSRRRIGRAIGNWPDVLVFGLDAQVLENAGPEATRAALEELTTQAENATAVPVVAGFVVPEGASDELAHHVKETNAWWRRELCRKDGLRLCVALQPHAGDPQAIRKAVAAAVRDALERHAVLRASTQ
jgi:hypothetical protein